MSYVVLLFSKDLNWWNCNKMGKEEIEHLVSDDLWLWKKIHEEAYD